MRHLLCTIGFAGKTAEEFFALLRQSQLECVIDVRQNRGGQLSAFAKYPDLKYFLANILNVEYRHEALLAPTPALRRAYQASRDWQVYEAAFLKLLKQRGVPGTLDTSAWPAKVALLCTEPGPEKCHRRLVADILAEYWTGAGDDVEVRHLVVDRNAAMHAEVKIAPTIKVPLPNRPAFSSHSSQQKISEAGSGLVVEITGSGARLGSQRVASEEVDRAFGMPIGKLRSRAGIESLTYATADQSELTLAAEAATHALQGAKTTTNELDWIIATSETHHAYPSLAAQVHKRLALRENCAALDVGGACLGLLNALATAQSFILSGQARKIAVVTSDVHSRTLIPGRVAGEFGGLFGDGASAFILGAHCGERALHNQGEYSLGRFFFGCASQYADAICVRDDAEGGLAVRFDGEALSRAAITRMESVIAAVEAYSGILRSQVGAFATHQPNPRLVKLLAKRCNVPASSFPTVARTSGNLGSSTCGVALYVALQDARASERCNRKPIFLTSLGPGLLFGGGWLQP
jgi:3-oxoacyl-[acyl-carrier-protein] synthase III